MRNAGSLASSFGLHACHNRLQKAIIYNSSFTFFIGMKTVLVANGFHLGDQRGPRQYGIVSVDPINGETKHQLLLFFIRPE